MCVCVCVCVCVCARARARACVHVCIRKRRREGRCRGNIKYLKREEMSFLFAIKPKCVKTLAADAGFLFPKW